MRRDFGRTPGRTPMGAPVLFSNMDRPLAHAWRRLGAAAELLGGATHGRLLDTLGELEAVADDDDFLAAAGALRTILEE